MNGDILNECIKVWLNWLMVSSALRTTVPNSYCTVLQVLWPSTVKCIKNSYELLWYCSYLTDAGMVASLSVFGAYFYLKDALQMEAPGKTKIVRFPFIRTRH